ncbi:hypothetical protein EVAR_89459_1 [Eumeta japonica]|uniref:Uncharacterized protein n=1 Tax=Eumeta variegata TaxID=151549 RepID=A0A4C1ZP81_EUMVA|nr:hypothetical protein EVAR_89459_1 [Eumeta japonica]
MWPETPSLNLTVTATRVNVPLDTIRLRLQERRMHQRCPVRIRHAQSLNDVRQLPSDGPRSGARGEPEGEGPLSPFNCSEGKREKLMDGRISS